jgi:threonine/homoserine/homoserine lactone efflux protein
MPVSLEIWFAFVVASSVLLAIPGPTVLLVVSAALGRGRVSGWATVPGVALGDLTAMTLSLAGAGAVLAASATLFTALKLAGAAYLVWLGLRLWRAPAPRLQTGAAPPQDAWRTFRASYVVTALNPKSIVFFVAFVPQFLDADAPLLPQSAVLVATFVALAAVNTALWAFAAGEMHRRLGRPDLIRLMQRTGGALLIGAGILTAMTRRAA